MNTKAALCAAVAVLAGCGGGGGESISGTPEGYWVGTVSNGYSHNTLVLEDGTYWVAYGPVIGGSLVVTGFLQGTGTSDNGSFTSGNLRDYLANGTVGQGSLSASFRPGQSFNGSVSGNGSTVTFTGTPGSGSYNYNTPASLANIAGAWSMTQLNGASVTVNIAGNGGFTATGNGCTVTGTFSPRPSGKNVFNVTGTSGVGCVPANLTFGGIGVWSQNGGIQQLIVALVAQDRSRGLGLLGRR